MVNGIYITSWSFAMVAAAVTFFNIGLVVDDMLRTEPMFMIGLMLLAIILSIGRLYWKVWKSIKGENARTVRNITNAESPVRR